MWSFSNNSRTKLSSQPLSRPASSLCPRSRQGPSTPSLWHASGHSSRPAWFLLPAMSPRGSLPQGFWCIAHLSLCWDRLGPQRLPPFLKLWARGCEQPEPWAGKPWLRPAQPTLTVALHHFSHSSLFLGESGCKFSMVCPGLGFFHPHFQQV